MAKIGFAYDLGWRRCMKCHISSKIWIICAVCHRKMRTRPRSNVSKRRWQKLHPPVRY